LDILGSKWKISKLEILIYFLIKVLIKVVHTVQKVWQKMLLMAVILLILGQIKLHVLVLKMKQKHGGKEIWVAANLLHKLKHLEELMMFLKDFLIIGFM
jgi:hypothetical protein